MPCHTGSHNAGRKSHQKALCRSTSWTAGLRRLNPNITTSQIRGRVRLQLLQHLELIRRLLLNHLQRFFPLISSCSRFCSRSRPSTTAYYSTTSSCQVAGEAVVDCSLLYPLRTHSQRLDRGPLPRCRPKIPFTLSLARRAVMGIERQRRQTTATARP